MFCGECGAKNKKGSAFCEKCGSKLEVEEEKIKKLYDLLTGIIRYESVTVNARRGKNHFS